MSIEKMSLAEVTGELSKLDEVLFRCLMMGNFQPAEASALVSRDEGFKSVIEENPYLPLLNQAVRIGEILGVDGEDETPKQAKEKARCINLFNRKAKVALSQMPTATEPLQGELEKIKSLISKMKPMEWVNMGLSYRLSTARMKAWTGTLEVSILSEIEKWDTQQVICQEVLRHGDTVWVIIFGNKSYQDQVEKLLISVDFREVSIAPPTVEQTNINGMPSGVGHRMDDLARKQRHLLRKLEENKDKIQDMGEFAGYKLGINNLYSSKYLKIRFGLLPTEGYQQLESHLEEPFLFVPICREGVYQWGVYFTTEDHLQFVDELFATLGFERIWMPQLSSEKTQVRITGWSNFLTKYQKELTSLISQRKQLTANIERYENAMTILRHVDELDVSFEDLFSCEFLKIRFGRLPIDSVDKLKYYADSKFIFCTFDKDEQYHWGVIFTTKGHEAETDEMFSSLYFERVMIPEFAHGTPETAQRDIQEQLDKFKAEKRHLEAQLLQSCSQHRENFYDIYAMAKYLSESFRIRKYVGRVKDNFRMVGFVPKKQEEQFKENLLVIDNVQVKCMPPDNDKRLKIPTLLSNNRFVKPFEMFLDLYGRPSYTDIDPTPLFAITYTLLFGIMFGDLGQGLAIALLGWIMSRKNGSAFGKILTRIGMSSAVFGFAYGSVFGMEHLLDPVFTLMGFSEKPIEVMSPKMITKLLVAAVGVGVILILISMFTNILAGLRQKDYEKAIFGNNGVAGLVFYISVLIGLIMQFVLKVNLFTPIYILLLIVLPIIVIFLKEPLGRLCKKSKRFLPEGGLGEFFIEGFFEMFEVLLSFVTNTMSFLRVGGFIISHAGMMTVVLTLTNMFDGGASLLVLIIGNIFVMGLEGFIVGIQCLRLEFYEMFSHYFQGEGESFTPVCAKTEN